jgi:NADPH:quinone reductase-like Zn-dependent oxidoreductase
MTTALPDSLPQHMAAVLLKGHGGLDALDYRTDVAVPRPGPDEVLINVRAAGVNNTDINTRIGWYSKSVSDDTAEGGADGFDDVTTEDATWSGAPMEFPRIQGADVCGVIVEVGHDVDRSRIGERVLVRAMMRHPHDSTPFACWTFGSEADGGFAQFVTTSSFAAVAVNSSWSDVELASIPCAYSTAENMLQRSNVGPEKVLITGASGGVGSAAVQLASRRGAHVIAMCSSSKADDVRALGASDVIDRNADLIAALGRNSVDVVVDLVAGPQWPNLLEVLRPGGRYVASGAIGGPITELDVRTLYLKDLSLFGATFQPDNVMTDLIGYIERDEIRPVVAGTYPLESIAEAQTKFLSKTFTGKLVLVPPPLRQ